MNVEKLWYLPPKIELLRLLKDVGSWLFVQIFNWFCPPISENNNSKYQNDRVSDIPESLLTFKRYQKQNSHFSFLAALSKYIFR